MKCSCSIDYCSFTAGDRIMLYCIDIEGAGFEVYMSTYIKHTSRQLINSDTHLWCGWHLRSASRHHLVVPRHISQYIWSSAFAIAGQAAWNSLSDELCYPALGTDSFRRLLKTDLFSEY